MKTVKFTVNPAKLVPNHAATAKQTPLKPSREPCMPPPNVQQTRDQARCCHQTRALPRPDGHQSFDRSRPHIGPRDHASAERLLISGYLDEVRCPFSKSIQLLAGSHACYLNTSHRLIAQHASIDRLTCQPNHDCDMGALHMAHCIPRELCPSLHGITWRF